MSGERERELRNGTKSVQKKNRTRNGGGQRWKNCFCDDGEERLDGENPMAATINFDAFDVLESRSPIVKNVMEALADPKTHLIGVYGSDDDIKDTLVEKVKTRIQRDNLFDPVLTTTVIRKLVTRKSDVRRIQKEIAHQLGLTFNHRSTDKRAQELIGRIKIEQKILIVLRDLRKGLDLGKVGIPYGSDHTGCKILLISATEDVLSNHMHTQKNFNVSF